MALGCMAFSSNPYFFRDGLPIKAAFFVGFFEGDAHLVETLPTLVETPRTLVETLLTLFQILLTLFQTPRNLFFGGLGGVGRKGREEATNGREEATNGREATTNGRGSGRKRGTFCDGMGCFCDGMGQKIPRGAGKQAGDAALGKGVRQKKSPRGGDVELFGGVVYNLYPREMSPARFLAPSSENLSTPKSASMPRVNPEGNWYATMACMPASKRFTPLRLKVFSS